MWGCTNRISNGRTLCDSHHIKEDVLERTYKAALESVIGDTGEVIDMAKEAARMVLAEDSSRELDTVQQEIIGIQERVLTLHKTKQQGNIEDAEYDLQILTYSQRMTELQDQQKELKATANQYAEVKYWLDTFKEHIASGEAMNTDDAVIMRSMGEKIVVYDNYIVICLCCGVTLEQEYI